ncbi:MAG: HAD-IC family P-type ATPase [Acidimicrobiales bacterium]
MSGSTAGWTGLSAAEVEVRRRAGHINRAPRSPGRTIGQILRANVLTGFNLVLGAIFVVVILVAPPQDGLFGVVLVANAAIGVTQELRARRTLRRLAVLAAPGAIVVRDGVETTVAATEVVVDDVVVLRAGAAVVVDGPLLHTAGLELDESPLTGESEPVPHNIGDVVRSGSAVVGGWGLQRAEGVGEQAYAVRLASEAQRFRAVPSELQQGLSRVLRWVGVGLVPASVLLVSGQMRAGLGWREGAQRSAAGIIALVPEGLVLLTSVAFAVGVVRLGRRHCLIKELPAVEVLARVDTLCVDKTGTLTEGTPTLCEVVPLGMFDQERARRAMAEFAAADPTPNATVLAARSALAVGETATVGTIVATADAVDAIAFSSIRKWSALALSKPYRAGDPEGAEDGTWWYLGAPEILGSGSGEGDEGVAALVAARTGRGQRVVLLGRGSAPRRHHDDEPQLPPGVEPVALVVFEERVRADAAATVAWFQDQGVTLKVISGDNVDTASAVARRVGVAGADRAVDARTLPGGTNGGGGAGDLEDPESVEAQQRLAAVMEGAAVFGRVTPDQKRAMVAALQQRGHVVAMTGDGVNDISALKEADLGIAMGSGSDATKAVARVVLLDGNFASLAAVVGEGQRVLANMERVANLFLTKTVCAFVLSVVVGVAAQPYPLLPRHLSLISAIGIGVPGFVLALAPARQPARPGFVRRVCSFAMRSGTVTAAAVLVIHGARGSHDATSELRQTEVALTWALMALVVLVIVARPLNAVKTVLIGSMALMLGIAVLSPVTRDVLALSRLDTRGLAAVTLAVLVSMLLVGRPGGAGGWMKGQDHHRHLGLRQHPFAGGAQWPK